MLNHTYPYRPVPGGFETVNGTADYVRPIYAPHLHDRENETRYLYYLGDRPKLVLSNVSAGNTNESLMRHGHLFLKLKDGKWFHEMDRIVARYVYGHEEYELSDAGFPGIIRLTYTRTAQLDAMLIYVNLPPALAGKFSAVAAGQQGRQGCQPQGGHSEKLKFVPADTEGTIISAGKDRYRIEQSSVNLCGTASVPLLYRVEKVSHVCGEQTGCQKSGGKAGNYPDRQNHYPALVAEQAGEERELYFLLTTEPAENPWLNDFPEKAERLFAESIAYYRKIADTIRVETPNPYLDSAIAAQMIALDASWDAPVICHGPITWHNGQAGWRGMYGFTTAGWYARVRENVRQYMKTQQKSGRIENYPDGDQRYHMGEVLVDELLHYWLWSGDDDFFAQGGYDLIAGHLRFQDSCLRVPGTDLYENWLNAWNTDNKWSNGGPGSISSAYTWHAHALMAQIAHRLGKEEDAVYYREKAETIRAEMKRTLWCAEKGVYAEYKDIFGLERLHDAPDLSSIYTPIDLGLTEETEAYQMLHYSDYAIDSIEKDGCEFKFSSNWLPRFYSSCGLYAEEVLHLALAWYRAGGREKAYRQYTACLIPLVNGRGAGPGACSHTMNERLENTGHIDFADTAAQYSRTVVEGLFGIAMLRPFRRVRIMPGFPDEWEYATIRTDYLRYSWKRREPAGQPEMGREQEEQFGIDGKQAEQSGIDGKPAEQWNEVYEIGMPEPLALEMRVPARSSRVLAVTVNGKMTDFTVNRYVCFTTEELTNAVIKVTFEKAELPFIKGAETAWTGERYRLSSNGRVVNILDPQGILVGMTGQSSARSKSLPEAPEPQAGTRPGEARLPLAMSEVTIGKKSGHHTFFAEIVKGDIRAILPVNLTIHSPSEKTEQTGALGKLPAEGETRYHMISLSEAVNQHLRTLHANSYDLAGRNGEPFVLPKFPFVQDTPRTVTATGRSWWEDKSRGQNGVPEKLELPAAGICRTDIGIPFLLSPYGKDRVASRDDGPGASFVSLYRQFPARLYVPVQAYGDSVYVMLCVSTNNMQSRIENARLTVYLEDGAKEELPLVNPDNIDDWLCYQERHDGNCGGDVTPRPYAQNGGCQFFGEKAHANILKVDLHWNRKIIGVELRCLGNEILVGLVGLTVAEKMNKEGESH